MQMLTKMLKMFIKYLLADANASKKVQNFTKLKKWILMHSKIVQKAFCRALG